MNGAYGRKYFVILLVVLLFVFSSIIVFTFSGYKKISNILNKSSVSKNEVIPTSASTGDSLSYTDMENKFEFSYPKDYILKEEVKKDFLGEYKRIEFYLPEDRQSETALAKGIQFLLTVQNNSNNYDIVSYYKDLCKDDLSGECYNPFNSKKSELKKLSSGDTVYYVPEAYCVTGCTKTLWFHSDKIYSFIFYYHGVAGQDEVFDSIFSSFRFMD